MTVYFIKICSCILFFHPPIFAIHVVCFSCSDEGLFAQSAPICQFHGSMVKMSGAVSECLWKKWIGLQKCLRCLLSLQNAAMLFWCCLCAFRCIFVLQWCGAKTAISRYFCKYKMPEQYCNKKQIKLSVIHMQVIVWIRGSLFFGKILFWNHMFSVVFFFFQYKG